MKSNTLLPKVSKELLEYLDKVFPEVVTLDTTENLQYNAGKRSVVKHLQQVHQSMLHKANV